jgi:D-tyrosyl-tRNA(Tyr) deacylase
MVLHPNPPPIWAEGIRARRRLQNFLSLARMRGAKVETGEFGATMDVELVNDGPVTIILDSRPS